MKKSNCYCCAKETEVKKVVFGNVEYNLCDECLNDYENARKEVDKLRPAK